jgi:subtilisin
MLLVTVLLLSAVPMGVIGDDETPVRVIVTFKDKVDEDLVKDNGGAVDHKYTYIPAVVADIKPSAIKKLEKSDKVKSVEEDAVAYAVDDADEAKGKPTPPTPPAPPAQAVPWGVNRIDADLVWPTNTGVGIDVAIIDTGIDKDHPDLEDNLGSGVNFVSSKGKVNSGAWDDDNGHGTHCAGIVGAVDNTEGVIGVAPGVTLHAVKVLNRQGSGSYTDIISGIEWCIGNGIEVISMSLSGSTNLQALHDECVKAHNAGIVLVAAAGNSGNDGSEYPAAYDDAVIAVGATDSSDAHPSWSNHGSYVDLVAPGVAIPSTYKGGIYKELSGTSMACPHVAGTAALVLKAHSSTPDEVQTCLQDTADDLWTSDPYNYYGDGLVDADGAVA